MTRRPVARCIAALLWLAASAAWADSWPAALTREVFSASREYFVRVVPGESLGDTAGFAGQRKGRHAQAEFYRRQPDRSYRLVAERPLLNPVAPVEFFVADDGRLATLDNWHNAGHGQVVVLYGATGQVLRSYALDDLFGPDEVERFPHSVSSIRWRDGPAYIRPDRQTLLVTTKSGANFVFGLHSGRYQFCETRGSEYRCRNTNLPRRWLTGAESQVAR